MTVADVIQERYDGDASKLVAFLSDIETRVDPSVTLPYYFAPYPSFLAANWVDRFAAETLKVADVDRFLHSLGVRYPLATADYYSALTAVANVMEAATNGTAEKTTRSTENSETRSDSGTNTTTTKGTASAKAAQPNTITESSSQNSGTNDVTTTADGTTTGTGTETVTRTMAEAEKIRQANKIRLEILDEFFRKFADLFAVCYWL